MKFKYFVFFLLICSQQLTYSQSGSSSKIEKNYLNYFELPRETIYLHLNKTTYLQGEKIWFSAYIYNRRTGLPFLTTTNLICGLYNSNGQQLDKKLLYVENGISSGHFDVKPSFENGNLYIKASTSYLKNFKEEEAYIQKIKIIGSEISNTKESSLPSEYDLQFLPEAGHIISGAKNTIGFIITDSRAKGISILNASLVNSKNHIIVSNISSNKYGIGKFTFEQASNETYFLQFELADGFLISKKIPTPKEKGIALAINNLFDNKLAIELRTNSSTLADIKEEDMYLAIHRDGLLTLSTFKLNTVEKSIYISKDKLLSGINIITLFNKDLKPISERLFFNETNVKFGKITAEIKLNKNPKDSVQIKLNFFSKKNTPSNISISVLPEKSVANKNHHSIYPSFLLKPYIKNEVENASYYFRNMNRKKRFELDMLLLALGWSRYNWNDIFTPHSKEKHPFDHGIQISGKVLNATYKQQNSLILYGDKIYNTQFASIDKNKNFIWKNTQVIKGDSVSVGLINEKDKLEKPKLLDIQFLPKLIKDVLTLKSKSDSEIIATYQQIETEKTNLDAVYESNTIALNNVTVTDNKIEKELTRNPALTVGVYNGFKVTSKDVKTKPILAQLIFKLGFRVRYNQASGGGVILPKKNAPGVRLPKVVVDDFVVVDVTRGLYEMPANLLTTSTDHIDEVYYEHFGVEGSNGGTIYIYRKYGSRVTSKQKENFTKMLVTEGFQRPLEYYNPKYSSNMNNDFLKYGVIHWVGKLSTDTTNSAKLNFPHFGLKKVKLFIEGMSQNGTLFSEALTISIN